MSHKLSWGVEGATDSRLNRSNMPRGTGMGKSNPGRGEAQGYLRVSSTTQMSLWRSLTAKKIRLPSVAHSMR